MGFDKSKFIDGFKAEIRDHIEELNNSFLLLEKNSSQAELFNKIMREIHTIKGSSSMMGYNKISHMAHKLEDGLKKIKDSVSKISKSNFDLFLKFLDTIEVLLEEQSEWSSKGVDGSFLESLCAQIDEIELGGEVEAKELSEALNPSKENVVGDVFPEKSNSLKISIKKLDNLMNLAGILKISEIHMKDLLKHLLEDLLVDSKGYETIQKLNEINEKLSFSISQMQKDVINLRMVPIEQLFNIFPRAMRDLASACDKDVDLEMSGHKTMLDKGIIDAIKDPLLHILRNAVDHGIETKDERLKSGKSESGTIFLDAYQKGSQIVIEISDDGRGIDVERVRSKIVQVGAHSQAEVDGMDDEQVYKLLFTPGFSMSDSVTDISGRGVGLDVVRDQVIHFKGMIEIKSKLGQGTSIMIKLPLTLTVTESLLIESGSEIFGIPLGIILETIRVDPKNIDIIEQCKSITLEGYILSLIDIKEAFRLPSKGVSKKNYQSIVVVQLAEKKIGLLVDKVVRHQDVVCKPLGYPLGNISKISNISGGTILGDGKLVLMLDVASMVESYSDGYRSGNNEESIGFGSSMSKGFSKTILLAEDSLSTAMLEKSVLESAGFSVVIAKNGEEALNFALQEQYDLVITDILMPRMDGFELTKRLKSMSGYKNVPVIIVTTRGGDADKKRGLEAGADVYLLKSNFTSDVILDTIERLIG